MNINSRYPVRHKLLLAGSGERAAVTLTRVAGYRRSPRGRQRRPIIRSNTHAPDQTDTQPRLLQCLGRPRRPGPVVILPLSDFHEVSRSARTNSWFVLLSFCALWMNVVVVAIEIPNLILRRDFMVPQYDGSDRPANLSALGVPRWANALRPVSPS